MKNYFGLLALVLMLFIQSCEKDNVVNEKEVSTKENIQKLETFKGLPVNHRFSTPIEELNEEHNEEVLKRIYNANRRAYFKREGIAGRFTEEGLPDMNTLAEAVGEVLDQFPYATTSQEIDLENIDINQELPENIKGEAIDMEMIKQDFPTLSDNDIDENIEIIDEYYAQNLDHEVLKEISENSDTYKRTSKRMSLGDYDDKEVCVFDSVKNKFGWSRSAYALKEARWKSESWQHFIAGGTSNTRKDALRHMLFNAYLCNDYLTTTFKSKCIAFASNVSSAVEYCPPVTNKISSQTMDFHNNFIGRFMFDYYCGYDTVLGVIVGLNKPDDVSLLIACVNFANAGKFIDFDWYTKNSPNPHQAVADEINKTYILTPVFFR